MNQSEFQRLLEASWQRPLSPEEEGILQQWLADHPQAQAHWEEEAALNRILQHWPHVPVASNFTARVLASVARDSARGSGVTGRLMPRLRLRRWQMRLAGAALMVLLGWGGVHFYHWRYQQDLRRGVQLVGNLAALPNPEILNDFEPIRQLSTVPQAGYVDDELLAALE